MEQYIYDSAKLPRPVLGGHPEWIDLYDKTWKLAFHNVEYLTRENWKPQLTCMPGVGITWQWDSCIMTFITNYANGTLSAFNNLDNLYRLQRKSDGFMAMAYRIEEECEAYPGRINPPLMAWAEWEHYEISGDSSRFARVVPGLEAFYEFIEKNRRRSCGLYWFEDPGSSGMDNAPRGGYPAQELLGSDVCFVDLGCQQALSALCLSRMNGVLGNREKEDFFRREHRRICDLINRYHWCEKTGFYYDFFARGDKDLKIKYINTKTGAAFWTLICGAATGERAEKVKNHLMNPEEFNTRVPFCTLSKDDLNYDPDGGYWLGGVWAPTNFVAIRGLAREGYRDLARQSAIRYLDAICQVYNDPRYGSIWEMYAPEKAAPGTKEDGTLCKTDFVGWSGIAPVTMLIEQIIGLQFRAEENTVIFHISSADSGLRNMNFNGGRVSVVCTALGETASVEAETEKPVTLLVRCGGREKRFELAAGKTTLQV